MNGASSRAALPRTPATNPAGGESPGVPRQFLNEASLARSSAGTEPR